MRKSILFLIGIAILQLNFSCKSQYSVTELNNNFSNEQISDLNKIRDFFINQTCLNTKSGFKKCYYKFPHVNSETTRNGFWTHIDFEKQQELYKQISTSTFSEIWMFCKSTNVKNGLERKSLCAVPDGKYQKFLMDIGKQNPRIAKYAERINASGNFNAFDIPYWNVLNDKKHFDLNDPNIQLILAIHYISLNDQEKRSEKWVADYMN